MATAGTNRQPPAAETMTQIRKWGCQFDGRDALSFLERIEELRIGCGFTQDQILIGLPVLLKGEPLLWYRNIRDSINSWDQFEKEFRLYYVPRRLKAQLEREIRDRMQQRNARAHRYTTKPPDTYIHAH